MLRVAHLAVFLLLTTVVVEGRVGRNVQQQAGTLESFGGNPDASRFPLKACQGDCDKDSDCTQEPTEQVCYHRNDGEEVPGCGPNTGEFSKYTDFCVPTFVLGPNYPVNNPSLEVVGKNGDFTVYPLKECMGDCDSDSDCEGNLICPSREPGTTVPGCRGMDRSKTDYCIDPSNNVAYKFVYKTTYDMIATFTYQSGAPSGSASSADMEGAIDAIALWLSDEGNKKYAKSTKMAYTGSDCVPKQGAAAPSKDQMTLTCYDDYAANAVSDVPSNLDTMLTVQGYPNGELVQNLREAQPSDSVYRGVLNVAYTFTPQTGPSQI